MSKVKIVFYLVLLFIAYKGFVAFQNFEIGVGDRVAQIEEKADFEKERLFYRRHHAKTIFPARRRARAVEYGLGPVVGVADRRRVPRAQRQLEVVAHGRLLLGDKLGDRNSESSGA